MCCACYTLKKQLGCMDSNKLLRALDCNRNDEHVRQ
jgi:hypothetical protein